MQSYPHHRMRQHPCLNRCAPTRSPVNTCRGHVRGYHVSRTIDDKHIVLLCSPLEPVHRVHILAHAVRLSLLLSGGLAGMFPPAFAAGLLLLSTFLRCYKLLEIERQTQRPLRLWALSGSDVILLVTSSCGYNIPHMVRD